jgi:hypothetical protein
MTLDNVAKFWKSAGRELVPPDHPIYQDTSWRISFVRAFRRKAGAEDSTAADDLKKKKANGTAKE